MSFRRLSVSELHISYGKVVKLTIKKYQVRGTAKIFSFQPVPIKMHTNPTLQAPIH